MFRKIPFEVYKFLNKSKLTKFFVFVSVFVLWLFSSLFYLNDVGIYFKKKYNIIECVSGEYRGIYPFRGNRRSGYYMEVDTGDGIRVVSGDHVVSMAKRNELENSKLIETCWIDPSWVFIRTGIMATYSLKIDGETRYMRRTLNIFDASDYTGKNWIGLALSVVLVLFLAVFSLGLIGRCLGGRDVK